MNRIYMDNAATSFPKPECVYRGVDFFNRYMGGNPGRGSSLTVLKSGSVLHETREALAELFNISDSARIAFALNVTEAINIGLKGILNPGDHVITTSMEHNSVARPLYVLSSARGVEWTAVPCSPLDGSLDPEELRKAIRPHTRMICMLHASNVTGTIMPLTQVGDIARENGILFMVDAAQTAGVLEVDVVRQNIDIMAFTGHKGLLGPQGTGGIYVKPGLYIKPLKEGGTGSASESLIQPDFMPDMYESGTQNTPGIAGLLAGVNFIKETGLAKIHAHEQALTRMLLEGLQEMKKVRVYGPQNTSRRTAVVPFNIQGLDCGEVSFILDNEYGITTRSGLHCAPLAHETLKTKALGACRLSPGFFSTEMEVMEVIKAIAAIYRRQRT